MHDAANAGATIIIHENFRFQPWYRAIRAALDRGAIGQVHQMTFRLRPGDGQGPDAYLARQPYFQKMTRFSGPRDSCSLGGYVPLISWAVLSRSMPTSGGSTPRSRGEDAGHILFEHPGGARALFDGNRHLDHAADNLRRTMGEALVEGTEGTLNLWGDGSVTLRPFRRCRDLDDLAR